MNFLSLCSLKKRLFFTGFWLLWVTSLSAWGGTFQAGVDFLTLDEGLTWKPGFYGQLGIWQEKLVYPSANAEAGFKIGYLTIAQERLGSLNFHSWVWLGGAWVRLTWAIPSQSKSRWVFYFEPQINLAQQHIAHSHPDLQLTSPWELWWQAKTGVWYEFHRFGVGLSLHRHQSSLLLPQHTGWGLGVDVLWLITQRP